MEDWFGGEELRENAPNSPDIYRLQYCFCQRIHLAGTRPNFSRYIRRNIKRLIFGAIFEMEKAEK